MAKPNFGTKRVCPETGQKFYDLGRDPITSPYTGKEYPLAFFGGEPVKETEAEKPKEAEAETDAAEAEEENENLVPLEDADADETDTGRTAAALDDEDADVIPDIDETGVDGDEET